MPPTRFHEPHMHLAAPFGTDTFGRLAERFARAFGAPAFLIAQTVVVLVWLTLNALHVFHYDPYPFILLNLAFSLQAAYAAPMILLAETRQADRDRVYSEADAAHREELAGNTLHLLQQNTDLTQQVVALSAHIEELTREIHGRVVDAGA
jgi:uncharacterized membrane protein